MNTSCMSCVCDMSRTHYFTHVVWRVGTRYADVRLVFAEFLAVVRRLILRNSKGNDQVLSFGLFVFRLCQKRNRAFEV